jgi:ABC-type antimicrobial peptide transport system permease subunit
MRRMIMKQVGWMTLIGGSVGLIGGWLLGWTAASRLFEMTSFDPIVMAVAAILLVIVAFGAGFIPAHRASRIHPMQALRYE